MCSSLSSLLKVCPSWNSRRAGNRRLSLDECLRVFCREGAHLKKLRIEAVWESWISICRSRFYPSWVGSRALRRTMKYHEDTWKDNSKQEAALDFLFQNQKQDCEGKQSERRSSERHTFFSRWESEIHENDGTVGAWSYLCSPLKLGWRHISFIQVIESIV